MDAIAKARACWQQWQTDEPQELLKPMTTADGARVCLTPKARDGCLSSLMWTLQLETKAGESVEREVAIPPEHVALFDFDGDGVAELVLSGPARGSRPQGPKAMSGYGVQILHLRAPFDEMPSTPPRPSWIGSGVPKLAPATIVRDVDGDGRPDLIFERFFEVALYDWDRHVRARRTAGRRALTAGRNVCVRGTSRSRLRACSGHRASRASRALRGCRVRSVERRPARDHRIGVPRSLS